MLCGKQKSATFHAFLQILEVLSVYLSNHVCLLQFSFYFSAEFEQKCKGNQDQLEADTNRLKEILKRENEERKNELRELEAFTKKENAERKAETEQINSILNAENEKRMKEAQALKDKMEKEKKELQAYLEKVRFYLLLCSIRIFVCALKSNGKNSTIMGNIQIFFKLTKVIEILVLSARKIFLFWCLKKYFVVRFDWFSARWTFRVRFYFYFDATGLTHRSVTTRH